MSDQYSSRRLAKGLPGARDASHTIVCSGFYHNASNFSLFLTQTRMLWLILFTLIFGWFLVKFMVTVRKYPPGPFALPILGNIPIMMMGFKRHGRASKLYLEWKEKYGPVYTVWLGPMPTIFITDYEHGHESMVRKGSHFVDRQNFFLFDILRWGRGIVNANGQHWQEQRRFALSTLRDFGLGKNVMEERIMLELEDRMSRLDKDILKAGGEITLDLHRFFDVTVGNIINRMLFSEGFSEEKEAEFFKLKTEMDKMLKDLSPLDILMADWNKNLPFFKTRYVRMLNILQPVFDFLKEQIVEKKRQIEGKGETADDFAEAFLNQMKKTDAGESFDEESLVVTLFDLWLAGQETTATTLYWAFAYLLLNPTIMEKLRAELDSVVGRNRKVKLGDRPKTIYLTAVVQETLRVSSIIPMNLWRVADEDVPVGQYTIRKGSVVAMIMSSIMNDKQNFKDPDSFNPDRFLQGESDQYVVPFSLGKRACIGEALARAELFLIIGNMVHSYNFEAVGDALPKMNALQEDGSLRTAQPYKTRVSRRK